MRICQRIRCSIGESSGPRKLFNRLALARRQLAAAPDGQAPKPQRTELDAPEAQHRMAEGLAVALDLAVAPFGERDLEPRRPRVPCPVAADEAHGARHRGPVGQRGAAPPAREILGADAPLDLNLVDARDLVARMEKAVAELAVIGEQEQALGVEVEATDREQPLGARGQEIDHDGAPLRIAPARHVAARLVQEQVAMRGDARGQRAAVDGDDVAARDRPARRARAGPRR